MSLGHEVTLFIKRTLLETDGLLEKIERHYGVRLGNTRILSFFSRIDRADNLRIAVLAIMSILRGERADLIVSRNLYAAFFLSMFRQGRMLFETHQLELGGAQIVAGHYHTQAACAYSSNIAGVILPS